MKTNLERGTRICSRCGEEKPFSEFHKKTEDPVGIQNYCKTCVGEAREERKLANPQYYQDVKLRHHYGISYEVYEAMLEDQNRVCAICRSEVTETTPGTVKSLHVDHNHETGKVRGLLCVRCNMGLGYFSDDIKLLRRAMEYLEADRG